MINGITTQVLSTHKKAIFFAISNFYAFGVASILMDLKKYSLEMIQNCDVLIYSDDISQVNKELLSQIHPRVYFRKLEFPEEWTPIIRFSKRKIYDYYGKYIYACLLGFELLKEYESVIYLDADLHITGDISELFEIEEEIAWRRILGWNVQENFSKVLTNPDDKIHAGNGGVYVYSWKLRKYNIGISDILAAFDVVKDLNRGGLNENLMTWLVYSKGIHLKELDDKVYNTPAKRATEKTRIMHFLDVYSTSTKPWKSLAAYLWFEDWAKNYQTWLNLGGTGPVNFQRKDYYELFGFDQLQKIEKLQTENATLKMRLKEVEKKNKAMESSKTWRLTKPFRKAYHAFKRRCNAIINLLLGEK